MNSTPVSIDLSLISAGPWTVLDLRPRYERLVVSCPVGVVCRIENKVSGKPLTPEDVANAYAIAQVPLLLANITTQGVSN